MNSNLKFLLCLVILRVSFANDCDTNSHFFVSGYLNIAAVAGPNAPYVKMKFYRFKQDTVDRPAIRKDKEGNLYPFYKEPEDTIPQYTTITDQFGYFQVCPFDSGVYKISMVLVSGDSLRHAVFTRACICISDTLKQTIPQIKINTINHRIGYSFINDMDPVDHTSCCEEFKNRIYNIECCKECRRFGKTNERCR